jgi:hypothetical protein
MSSLLVFDRVYTLENGDTVSHSSIFEPSFVNYRPSNLLSGSSPPLYPLPIVKVQYVLTVCGWEGVGGS